MDLHGYSRRDERTGHCVRRLNAEGQLRRWAHGDVEGAAHHHSRRRVHGAPGGRQRVARALRVDGQAAEGSETGAGVHRHGRCSAQYASRSGIILNGHGNALRGARNGVAPRVLQRHYRLRRPRQPAAPASGLRCEGQLRRCANGDIEGAAGGAGQPTAGRRQRVAVACFVDLAARKRRYA